MGLQNCESITEAEKQSDTHLCEDGVVAKMFTPESIEKTEREISAWRREGGERVTQMVHNKTLHEE